MHLQLSTEKFFDLQAFNRREGEPNPLPTYTKNGNWSCNQKEKPSRLDYFIGNDAARLITTSIVTDHDQRISTHATVIASLSVSSLLAPRPILVKPKPFPCDDLGGITLQQRKDWEEQAVTEHIKEFNKAIQDKDPGKAWTVWNTMGVSFLSKLTNSPKFERGHVMRTKHVIISKQCNGIATNGKLRVISKLRRQTVTLKWSFGHVPIPTLTQAMWKNFKILGINKNFPVTAEDCDSFESHLDNLMKCERNRIKAARLKQWRRQLINSEQSAYKWLRNKFAVTPSILPGPDGKPTACPVDQLEGAVQAWAPYISRYDKKEPPCHQAFILEYSCELQACSTNCDINDLTGKDLLFSLKKRPDCKAGGNDAWRTVEMKQMTCILLDPLAILLNLFEDVGFWPEAITECQTSLIPKGVGHNHLDLRPITLNSVIYSIWATSRARQTADWQESFCPDSLYGARKGIATLDAEIPGALQIEISHEEKPLVGFAEDRAKCFDMFDARAVVPPLYVLGLPFRLVRALLAYYKSHCRRFKLHNGVSRKVYTQSTVQGDAWSTRIVNAAFSCLALRAKKECPAVVTQFFVDDSKNRVEIDEFRQLEKYCDCSKQFNDLTGQQTNISKCVAWGTTTKARVLATTLVKNGGSVQHHFKSLGFCANTVKARRVVYALIKTSQCR